MWQKHILTKKPDWWKQWFIVHIYIFFALLRVSSVLNDLFKLSQFLIELKLFYQNKNHVNFGLNWRRASTGWILIHLNVPILVMWSLQRSTLSRFYRNKNHWRLHQFESRMRWLWLLCNFRNIGTNTWNRLSSFFFKNKRITGETAWKRFRAADLL